MSRSSTERVRRRLVKKGMLAELKRQTGRSFSHNQEALKMIESKIVEKEQREKLNPLR